MKKIISYFKEAPKRIFLFDAIGAGVAAILFGCLIIPFIEVFGMPIRVPIYFLVIACCLCLFSILCYLFIQEQIKPVLRLLIGLNSLYLFTSLFLIFRYFTSLTALGIMYFIGDLIVIFAVIYVEYCVLNALRKE